MGKLSALFVKNAPAGKHEDGLGLRLVKRADGGGTWVFRYSINGRRREMGIGGITAVSLKLAREIAAEHRASVAQGIDQIRERQKVRHSAISDGKLLKDVAKDAFESRKAELKGDGKAGRWFSPIELHILPKLGFIPIGELNQRTVRDALEPIWHEKAATAKKAADRLNIIIQHAAALGIDVDLQVVGKAKALLGRQRHITAPIPSLPWQEVPFFYATLNELTPTHLALRLLILTGLRSGPVRFARWEQIADGIWTVPAKNMKSRVGSAKDFRVPLSDEAKNVIEQARPLSREGFLFPSVRKGVISDATMSRYMERNGMSARPHGFRTSLRTWLAEETTAPHEVAETMIAHLPDNKVVRTYRQTDFLDQRRDLLAKWAKHVTSATEHE